MKKIIPFSISVIIVLALSLSSCAKLTTKAVVIKDCTGSYIRIDQKDYLVCNYQILQSYSEGTEISVNFQKEDECNHLIDLIVCEMYHQNEGLIRITKIN